MPSKKTLKVGWHLGLAALALYEMALSEKPLRKMFCGACFGWHVGAAVVDFEEEDEVTMQTRLP